MRWRIQYFTEIYQHFYYISSIVLTSHHRHPPYFQDAESADQQEFTLTLFSTDTAVLWGARISDLSQNLLDVTLRSFYSGDTSIAYKQQHRRFVTFSKMDTTFLLKIFGLSDKTNRRLIETVNYDKSMCECVVVAQFCHWRFCSAVGKLFYSFSHSFVVRSFEVTLVHKTSVFDKEWAQFSKVIWLETHVHDVKFW